MEIAFVKLNADGSYYDSSTGRWLFGFSSMMRPGDHILAELSAIKAGIMNFWVKGYYCVVCATNSWEVFHILHVWNEDTVIQIHQYKDILPDIHSYLQRGWQCILIHISRDINNFADLLANWASHRAC